MASLPVPQICSQKQSSCFCHLQPGCLCTVWNTQPGEGSARAWTSEGSLKEAETEDKGDLKITLFLQKMAEEDGSLVSPGCTGGPSPL